MKSFKQHLAEETAEDIIKMVPGGKDAEAVYETWVFIVAKLSGNDTLPTSKVEVTFKFLSHGDEKILENELKGLKKLNKLKTSDVSTRMKHIITSINGDTERKTIREFVDNNLLARDARELRNYASNIQPDVDLSFDYEDIRGDLQRVDIPIEVSFFWPDAGI